MIKHVKAGYRVVGKGGRNMGTFKTHAAAQHRLDTIERLKGEHE